MNSKLFKIFIASPSDTSQERKICDKVFDELNKGIGTIFNFRAESIKWENDVRPTIKMREGQAEINDQVADKYDVFIGIMNKKFGTATSKAGSGTEEEFNIALGRYLNKEEVEVIFYFNDAPPPTMSAINLPEYSKIEEFKTKISKLGIYGSYMGESDFEEKLRKNLTKYFIEYFKKETSSSQSGVQELINKEALRKIFHKRLSDSLIGFEEQPIVWIEPVLSRSNEISQNPDENYTQRVQLDELIFSEKSYIVKAPPQFGLTTLAHHLVKEAWEQNRLFIYLDSNSVKPHTIHNAVNNEVKSLDQKLEDVKLIILDSWKIHETGSFKKLKNLIDANKDIPIIVMQTIDDSKFLEKDRDAVTIDKEFDELHLIALPRHQIRKVVSQYNKTKKIEDEDKVLNKVVSDLESLNIHRTPYNCLTILKVSERNFDESPVNRTKLIEMILFVLFDMSEGAQYKIKPDVKDSEFVLGKFCEILIRDNQNEFTKDGFLSTIKAYCQEKYILLETDVVFNVLFANRIIVQRNGKYGFRSTFWIYYFAAKRMHLDEDFRKYIFDSKKYASCPEIMEFYTGIDRNRNDALEILIKDVSETCNVVSQKIGMTKTLDPLSAAKWKPTEASIAKMQEELSENVINSNLPDVVKDQYIDRSYNQVRPYVQNIGQIFEEYSLISLMHKLKASSTSLRNSDYANPTLKQKLLSEIYRSWEQLSNVLFALTPVLANEGSAAFDNATFYLSGDFGKTPDDRLNRVLTSIPANVVGFFKDDIYSPKIAPLLYERFVNEENPLLKHQQALLLIHKRPLDWRKQIENYIVSLNKDSFYLYNTVRALRGRYRYDFADENELRDLKYLAKMGLAKNHYGDKKPLPNKINTIPDSSVSKREFDDH